MKLAITSLLCSSRQWLCRFDSDGSKFVLSWEIGRIMALPLNVVEFHDAEDARQFAAHLGLKETEYELKEIRP